jgi:hypothetical protein
VTLGLFFGSASRGGMGARCTLTWLALGVILPAMSTVPAQAEPSAGEHPRLVFTSAEVAGLQAKAATPEGQAILSRLAARVAADAPTDGGGGEALYHGFRAAGYGLLYQLTGEASHAATARTLVDETIGDVYPFASQDDGMQPLWGGSYKMIYRTDPAVGVALAYDLCYDAWDATYRESIAAALDDKADEILDGGGAGWNGSDSSNWTANTGSGAGICALAMWNDPGSSQAATSISRAKARIDAYMSAQSGTRGWTQEGWNYYRYPLTHHLLPFLQAYPRVTGDTSLEGTAADWYALLYTTALPAAPGKDYVPLVNASGQWEENHWRSGDFALGMGTVPAVARPAFQWLYQKWFGLEGDGTFDVFHPHHAVFALNSFVPGIEPPNPETVLAKVWQDEKKGLYVFRNRWMDADDFITTFDMALSNVGGTAAAVCGGGFQIIGLGGHWAAAGPKKSVRVSHNVVQAEGADGAACGPRLFFGAAEDGSGVVTVDTTQVYAGHPQLGYVPPPTARSFATDYSGMSGADGLFSVLDLLDDISGKTWQMHTDLSNTVTIDGSTFTITSPSGETMYGLFITPGDVSIIHNTDLYDTGKGLVPQSIIQATGSGEAFWVVMTVQDGDVPDFSLDGCGLDATLLVGDQRVWVEDGNLHILYVPEPGSAAVMALGAMPLLSRRRGRGRRR